MKFIALKNEDGRITGKIAFYCRALDVSRQGFYNYLEYRDIYGKVRMREAFLLKKKKENL